MDPPSHLSCPGGLKHIDHRPVGVEVPNRLISSIIGTRRPESHPLIQKIPFKITPSRVQPRST